MLLNIKTFISSLNNSWAYFKIQIQRILIITSVSLILINTFNYGSLRHIILTPKVYNTQSIRDITLLVKKQILLLIKENKRAEVVTGLEHLYKSTTSIRYLIYMGKNDICYGVPYSCDEVFDFSNITPRKRLETLHFIPDIKPNNKTIVTRLIIEHEDFSGLLLLGLSSSFSTFNTIFVSNNILSLLIVFSISFLIFGFIIFKMTITNPLYNISKEITNMALGKFSTRLTLKTTGEFDQLVANFNELGRKLQLYEVTNQELLNNEKSKLETITATIRDGILLLDTDLKIILVNTTAIRIFNWTAKKKLINTSIWEHLPIVLQKKLFVTLQKVLRATKSTTFDGKIDNDINTLPNKQIRITVKVIYDSFNLNQVPIGIGLTIQDRTNEVELMKTQNRFIGNISHELRTPLFNIKSFIETIQEYDYTLSHWQKDYFLRIVNKETNRLTRLVNDVLWISKLDSRNEIPLKETNIKKTIYQTTASYQILARDKGLFLHSEVLTNASILGNKDLLLQVLINLVGNALKFTYEYGEIVIRLYSLKNKKVRLEIFDTGIGIIRNYQPYIFQRFYRIENDVHTLKGTGLGLSIVNTILLEHRTKIQLISHYKVGSVFWFDLTEI